MDSKEERWTMYHSPSSHTTKLCAVQILLPPKEMRKKKRTQKTWSIFCIVPRQNSRRAYCHNWESQHLVLNRSGIGSKAQRNEM